MKESIRLIRPFLRGLPFIIMSLVLGILIARKYLTYVTPMYESTVKIKLADLTQGLPNNNLFKDFDVFASSNKIAAEIELMTSSSLLAKTTDVLHFNGELYRVGDVMVQELYMDAPIKVTPISLINSKSVFLSDDTVCISIENGDVFILVLSFHLSIVHEGRS